MKSQKQYGLSIDTDVALWMESRMTEGKPMLDGMAGFIFINSELHDNFDSFKSQHCSQGYSTFPYISLLKKWNEQRAAPSSPFKPTSRCMLLCIPLKLMSYVTGSMIFEAR